MVTHCIPASTACASMAGSQRRESETGRACSNAGPHLSHVFESKSMTMQFTKVFHECLL